MLRSVLQKLRSLLLMFAINIQNFLKIFIIILINDIYKTLEENFYIKNVFKHFSQ